MILQYDTHTQTVLYRFTKTIYGTDSTIRYLSMLEIDEVAILNTAF